MAAQKTARASPELRKGSTQPALPSVLHHHPGHKRQIELKCSEYSTKKGLLNRPEYRERNHYRRHLTLNFLFFPVYLSTWSKVTHMIAGSEACVGT